MFDSFPESASVPRDLLRTIFATLDRPVYGLLMIVYELFFNVASADLFSNNTIMKFYGRVQVILGVFMMFQLAMTILRGIIEPDSFSKEKGGGTLLKRVSISLILITILMPISVGSPRNEYEIQINNNGLLFGTLYSLQHRILSNNSIGRLVLGTTGNDTTFMNTKDEDELAKSARIFTSTVLKGFYRINLVPEDQRKDSGTKDPATINENRMCTDIDDKVLAAYTRLDADPGDILGMATETCEKDFNLGNKLNNLIGINAFAGSKKYVFTYAPLVSLIVGIIFIFVLLSFTIDVAVRAIKLAILRLIAPIPIIAYMDPKGSKDDMFKSWVKTLTSTYLDLFIRLAVVYFVIFLIQDMIVNGIVINHGSGVIGTFSLIIIWIGLFIFAKQAPDFIKKVLGLKDAKFSLFSGFGQLAAAATVPLGMASGAVSRAAASYSSTGGNQGKKILAGIGGAIAGGVGGATNAGKAYFTSKDFDAKGNMAKIREYNARNYSNAADESTFGGRFMAGLERDIGLRNSMQQYDDRIKYFGAAESALGRINKAFDNNGDYKIKFDKDFVKDLRDTGIKKGLDYHFSKDNDLTDRDGNIILKHDHSYSLKEMNDMISRVSSSADVDMRDAVDEAKKQAQGIRFTEIRSIGSTKADRDRLVQWVNDPNNKDWTENDLVAYDAAHTIYEVAGKYQNDAVFTNLKGKSFDSPSWGQYKGAAAGAGRKADQIKNSNEYAQAKANAQRAEQQSKK